MNDNKKGRNVRMPCSSLSVPVRKRVKKEICNDAKASCLRLIKGEQTNDTNLGCCHECSDPVECDYYCEWLVLKYANNPTLQNVCKMKW